jgi:hypothetical protein
MTYTHNLTIRIVNLYNEIINNNDLLNLIKNELIGKEIVQSITYNQSKIDYILVWKKHELKKPYCFFVSDIFTNSSCLDDDINFEHIRLTLNDIERKLKKATDNWTIVFYLSRTL